MTDLTRENRVLTPEVAASFSGQECWRCGLRVPDRYRHRYSHEGARRCMVWNEQKRKMASGIWPCPKKCQGLFTRLGIPYEEGMALNEARQISRVVYVAEKYARVANLCRGPLLTWVIKQLLVDPMFWEAIEMHLLIKPGNLTILNYCLAEYEAEKKGGTRSGHGALANKRIMIVSKDRGTQKLCRRALTQGGLLTEAPTITRSLQRLFEARRPDCVQDGIVIDYASTAQLGPFCDFLSFIKKQKLACVLLVAAGHDFVPAQTVDTAVVCLAEDPRLIRGKLAQTLIRAFELVAEAQQAE